MPVYTFVTQSVTNYCTTVEADTPDEAARLARQRAPQRWEEGQLEKEWVVAGLDEAPGHAPLIEAYVDTPYVVPSGRIPATARKRLTLDAEENLVAWWGYW